MRSLIEVTEELIANDYYECLNLLHWHFLRSGRVGGRKTCIFIYFQPGYSEEKLLHISFRALALERGNVIFPAL